MLSKVTTVGTAMQASQNGNRPVRLTAAFVKNVKDAGSYGDARGGFGLRLIVRESASGRLSKGWVQRVRVNGRVTNVGLGSYPLTTLDEARDAAYQNARSVRHGVDVLAERRKSAAVPTFSEAAESVIALYSPSWKGARTAVMWRQRLTDYAFPRMGRMRVDAITSADVLACVMPIWASKATTARKTLQYIGAVLGWAVAQGHAAANVATGDAIARALPRTSSTVQHLKALDWRDLAAALDAITEANAGATTETHALALRFLALTATRSGEVRGMTWAEIDGATWEIPTERTKMGRPHRVPLSKPALAILDAARQDANASGRVFSTVTGREIYDSAFSKLFRANGLDATAHGMRAAFRTWAAECGHDRQLTEFALGHVEGSAAEMAYLRGDLFERRAGLMEDWARAIA